MPKINNWCIIVDWGYSAPGSQSSRIYGEVYGHSRLSDGEIVRTSSIVEFTETGVRTKNTDYDLGQPSPKYVEKYPNIFKYMKDKRVTLSEN